MNQNLRLVDGRTPAGRFGPGNKFGLGNPFFAKIALLRSVLLKSVTTGDIRKIVRAMVQKAQNGDIGAARFIIPYCVGAPATEKEIEREIAEQNRLQTCSARELTDAELNWLIQDAMAEKKQLIGVNETENKPGTGLS